jgi:DNA-binding transcriptional LysR family regulator
MVVEAEMSYRALEERRVDLAITRLTEPTAEDHLEAELLYDDPLFVLASATNPWSRRRRVRLADLMNEPWALPPADTLLGATLADTFRAAGLDFPAATVVCTSGLARIALAARGRFLTIASESARIAATDMPIKALPINLSETQRPVRIITLKNRTLTPVAQLFIDCARSWQNR